MLSPIEPMATLIRVDDDSFQMLVHMFDDDGKLVDVAPCPILGFIISEAGTPDHVLTLRGIAPTASVAIRDMGGFVHARGNIFPNIDKYKAWAKKEVQ